MIDYTLVLRKKYPNSLWKMDGDDYDGLEWLSKNKKPTKAELESHWEKVQIERVRGFLSLSRRRFKIGEALYQVNGTPLVELIEALLAGLTEPTKTVATISYEQSGSFDRLDPFVLQFSDALGMSDEETDAFFHYCINEEWNQ